MQAHRHAPRHTCMHTRTHKRVPSWEAQAFLNVPAAATASGRDGFESLSFPLYNYIYCAPLSFASSCIFLLNYNSYFSQWLSSDQRPWMTSSKPVCSRRRVSWMTSSKPVCSRSDQRPWMTSSKPVCSRRRVSSSTSSHSRCTAPHWLCAYVALFPSFFVTPSHKPPLNMSEVGSHVRDTKGFVSFVLLFYFSCALFFVFVHIHLILICLFLNWSFDCFLKFFILFYHIFLYVFHKLIYMYSRFNFYYV